MTQRLTKYTAVCRKCERRHEFAERTRNTAKRRLIDEGYEKVVSTVPFTTRELKVICPLCVKPIILHPYKKLDVVDFMRSGEGNTLDDL